MGNSALAAGRPDPDYHPSGALLALIDMKPRCKGELAMAEAAISRPGAAVSARAAKFRR